MSASKPVEELYDTEADPWEVHNLAALPEHRATLERMRKRLQTWIVETIDLGFLPEADLRTRFGETAPYAAVRKPIGQSYSLPEILRTAELASSREPSVERALRNRIGDADPAVRFWAVVGLGVVPGGSDDRKTMLRQTVTQPGEAPIVRAAGAESLCRLGEYETAIPVLAELMGNDNEWVRLYAAGVLDRQGLEASGASAAIQKGENDSNDYVKRVCHHATMVLSAE
jgi:hypothetical protein